TDGTGYSRPAIPIATAISDDISGQADGTLVICVIGSDGTQWQEYTAATSHSWRKDTLAPTAPSIAINNGDSYTKNSSLSLALAVTDSDTGTEMYVTETASCSGGGTWESFACSKVWNLGNTNTTGAPVYVQ